MLASGPGGPDQAPSIWAISVVGGQLRKLRDNAWLATPSPDGSAVAFISPDYREIWLMNANGEEPRKLLAIESGATFAHVSWAPNGQELTYLKNYSLTAERVIESCDLKGEHAKLIWSDPRLRNFCWTPVGRIIGTLAEPNPDTSVSSFHSDLWEVDVRKGRPANAPRRLTNFAGFRPLSLSVTADGKQLALIRNYDQSDVYVGELEANASRLISPRRFTLDDRIDWPGGWTRDSKAILFYSDRQGMLNLFKQPVEERVPELLLTGSEERRNPQISPDDSRTLYLAWPRMLAGKPPAKGKLMQIPASGGPPQVVMEVKGYPGSAQVPRDLNGARVLTTAGQPDFRCPRLHGSSCLLSEGDSNKITFSPFDAVQGKKGEAVNIEVNGVAFWDLSPDGSKIAVGELGRNDRIRVLPVNGGGSHDVRIKGFRLIASVGWSADGASLFLTGTAPEGGSIIRHFSLDGRSQPLYKADAWLERPMQSPNGRFLLFGQATSSNNVWRIENF